MGIHKHSAVEPFTNRYYEFLCINVLSSHPIEWHEKEFYIISQGTEMNKTDSLGDFYGSFSLDGIDVHVFEKLYDDQ